VGGTREQVVNTRVVSATNKNIEALVEKEKFRRDLYFRLCVVKAEIPSLNQRPDDIMPLAKHFLHEFGIKFGKSLKGFSEQARDQLLSHNFSGNVRELKNIVERAALVTATDLVAVGDLGLGTGPGIGRSTPAPTLPDELTLPEAGIHLDDLLADIERKYMALAIGQCRGNESQAARLLNMNHHTFRYRWKKLKG